MRKPVLMGLFSPSRSSWRVNGTNIYFPLLQYVRKYAVAEKQGFFMAQTLLNVFVAVNGGQPGVQNPV
jgi:hypothetical protein